MRIPRLERSQSLQILYISCFLNLSCFSWPRLQDKNEHILVVRLLQAQSETLQFNRNSDFFFPVLSSLNASLWEVGELELLN